MAKDQELLIRINGSAKQFNDEIERVNKKTKSLQENLIKVAKVSSAAFVGLAASIGGVVSRFSNFEKEFTNVQTLLDKSSFSTKTLSEGVEGLKNGVLELGAESGESFETLNKGLFDIISATGDAENSMEVLKRATNLAIAGGTDVSVAVDGITTSIKAFGLETSDAESIANKFFQAQKGGKTTVAELSSSIGVAASSAAAYGVSLDEVLASTSAATLAGIKTNTAFTSLKAAFASIAKPTAEAVQEAKRLGIEFNSTALRSQGLEGFLNSLTTAQGFNQKSIEKLFGSVEAQGILFALTGKQAGDFANQLKLLKDEQGAAAVFAEALAVKQETTDKALARLAKSADRVAIVFGEAFAPTINSIADGLAAVAKEIGSLDKETIATIATVLKITTAIIGLTAAVATTVLGYLKLKAVLIATGGVLAKSTLLTKIYNFTLLAGQKALTLFRRGLILATTTARGFAAATGIGLVIVALSLLITNFDKSKAVAIGTFKAIEAGLRKFAENGNRILKAFGEILVAALTLDKAKLNTALDDLSNALKGSFDGIGEAAGKAFDEGFKKSLEESKQAQLRAPASTPGAPVDGQDDKDLAALRKKLKAEQDARDEAARIKAEKEAEQRELKRQADLVDQELDAENKLLLNEKEIEDLNNQLLTRDQIKRQNALDNRKREIARRNQFLKDEIKHGREIAQLKFFFSSEEVKLADQTSGQLVKLSRSKNETLKGIGKAAALTQIGIDTARGAIAAYSALAGIPYVGPALGIAAAAALTAFGAEQAAQVLSAQRGGVVPNLPGTGGARDRVPALLEPGEIVIPKSVAPDFQQAFGRPGPDVGEGGPSSMDIEIGFTDDAFEIIEQKLLERRAIGVGSF